MNLRKYKELLFCLTLLFVPSLAGCFGTSSSPNISLGDVDVTLTSSRAEMDAAILGAYSIQTNVLGNDASDESVLNTATLSDAKFLKMYMSVGVFELRKTFFVDFVKSGFAVMGSDGAYEPLYNFVKDEVTKSGASIASDDYEKLASYYFDLLVKKHIIISLEDAKAYIDTRRVFEGGSTPLEDSYVMFSPDQDTIATTLARHILGADATEDQITNLKNKYASILAKRITGSVDQTVAPEDRDYKNRVYADHKLSGIILDLVADASGTYRTTTLKLPVGQLKISEFVILDAYNTPIFAVPKKTDPIAALLDDKDKALPWKEVIEKDKTTVRASSDVKVVPMSSMALVEELGSGYLRFGLEALHNNYRYTNLDILAFSADKRVEIPSNAVINLKMRYVKSLNGQVDEVQTLGGSKEYAEKTYLLKSTKDRMAFLLPDFYKNNPRDREGSVIFTVEITFAEGENTRSFVGQLRESFDNFLDKFSTAITPFDNAFVIEVKEKLSN